MYSVNTCTEILVCIMINGPKFILNFEYTWKKIDIVKISFLKWFEYTTCIHDNVPYAV